MSLSFNKLEPFGAPATSRSFLSQTNMQTLSHCHCVFSHILCENHVHTLSLSHTLLLSKTHRIGIGELSGKFMRCIYLLHMTQKRPQRDKKIS